MRISDWSSDVCSSDLAEIRLQSSLDVLHHFRIEGRKLRRRRRRNVEAAGTVALAVRDIGQETARHLPVGADRIGEPVEALPERRFARVKRQVEIGSASCRERVCTSGWISVVPEIFKKQN